MAVPGLSGAASPLPASRSLLEHPALLWLLVALAALALYPPHEIFAIVEHLAVRDTDDAMRLVDVRALVAGQGWFDTIQHRFLPPEGVPSHWSRLVDAPMAAAILTLAPLVGQTLAEGLTAALWPALLMGLYALVLHRGVRRGFGSRAGILAVFSALELFGVTVQFSAGRVDHHNLQILSIVGVGLCLIRPGFRGGLLAGGLCALSLAIGLEGLPYVALAGLFVAGDWIWRGRPALPPFLGLGLGLGLASPLLFAAQTAPPLWSTVYCDALSPPWLWLAGGGLATALACAGLDRRLPTPALRLAAAGGLGIAVVAGFAALSPACLGGPFPGMPALVREHWLFTVNEMISLPKFVANGKWEVLAFYPPLAFAAVLASWAAFYGPPEHRRHFAVCALFLWPGFVIGWFQFRGLYIASGLIPLVAGPAMERAIGIVRDTSAETAAKIGRLALAMGLVSPVWMVPALLSALADPAVAEAMAGKSACRTHEAVTPLASLAPGTVLAPVWVGPAILLYTPHSVIAAPYHRAIPGLTAAIEGLGGSEADLRRHVEARHADYVVLCPKEPEDSLGPEKAFATRLAAGEVSAPWLAPVAVPGTVLKVWRVVR